MPSSMHFVQILPNAPKFRQMPRHFVNCVSYYTYPSVDACRLWCQRQGGSKESRYHYLPTYMRWTHKTRMAQKKVRYHIIPCYTMHTTSTFPVPTTHIQSIHLNQNKVNLKLNWVHHLTNKDCDESDRSLIIPVLVAIKKSNKNVHCPMWQGMIFFLAVHVLIVRVQLYTFYSLK